VHQEFWDGVNFRRGANPPREQWKPPGQKPPEQTDQAFERFGAYIDYIRSSSGIHFVTAADLPKLYPDQLKDAGATGAEIGDLAKRITGSESLGIDFQIINGKAFSPADQFALLCSAMEKNIHSTAGAGDEGVSIRIPTGLLGPDGAPPSGAPSVTEIGWYAFRDAALEAHDYVQFHHRIPARVFIGPDAVAPADFLAGLARAYLQMKAQGAPPEKIAMKQTDVLTARRVAKDEPGLYGGWVIHRENYRAPKVLEIAKLQAWTLKPAMLAR
jgi:hypothetical protein